MIESGERGAGTATRAGSLPAPSTPLVGRDADIGAILRDLNGNGRLLTAIGTGGVGKSRLAIAAGHAWPGPVVFVPLASLTDASLVPTAVVEAFGAAASLNSQLYEAIGEAAEPDTLLILDNFEHVLDAAPFVGDLLDHVGTLRVMVTSRRRMRLEAERIYDVAPLDSSTVNAPGVRLFVDRARAYHSAMVLPDTQLPYVRGICERLDGLPLAIELAARSAHLIAPETMLRRLEAGNDLPGSRVIDQSPRHSTLLATIAWSIDLLTPVQRQWWEMLGVFQGGCTVEAARDVARCAGLPEADEVETMDALIDAGLVRVVTNRVGEPRIAMLDTTLRVARQMLSHSGTSAAIEEAHTQWITAQTVIFDEGIRGDASALWQPRIDADMPNVRRAVDRLLAAGRLEDAMRIIGMLEWHWTLPPNLIEGRRWTDDLLSRLQPGLDPEVVARLWDTAGTVADWQADTGYAVHCMEQSLPLWRQLGRDDRIANLLLGMASTALDNLELDKALDFARESIAKAHEVGNIWNEGGGNNLAATILVPLARYEEAITHFTEAYRLYELGGFLLHLRSPLHGLADCYIGLGQLGTALEYLDAALARCEWPELVSQTPSVFQGYAEVAIAVREWEIALTLSGAVAAQRRILGIPMRPHKRQAFEHIVAAASARVGRAKAERLRAEGASMSVEDLRAVAERMHATDAAETGGLSRRELDVLALLAEGGSDADIADRLFITRRTASKHVASILTKLDAANRTAAATIAIRRGLI
jgi:predicted ATPase/DNA-binding CsgD family transcriptional regulator